jgi:putative flavoprotein involved in K+ transport
MNRANQPFQGHHVVVIVDGGQAGLSLSYYLKQRRIEHLVLEKHRVMHAWRTQRWDAFCLVTPNWQCVLPDYPYGGDDPHGFMVKDQINEYLDGFARHVAAPVREGVAVRRVTPRAEGGFVVSTSDGTLTAGQVAVASGGYHLPIIPRMAERLPRQIVQLHSAEYRSPRALPEGAV